MKFSRTLLYLALLTSPVTVACSGQNVTTAFKNDVKAMCDAYNPQTWGIQTNEMDAAELANTLVKKIQDAAKTEEMKDIVIAMPKQPRETVYDFYKTRVSTLIGESYECDNMKNYYNYSIQ